MIPRPPLNIQLYTPEQKRLGWLNDPDRLEIRPRHLAVGLAKITVPTDHRKLPILADRGARAVIDYGDGLRMSGLVRNIQGKGGRESGEVTCTVEDDARLLWRILGWPAPGNTLANQTVARDDRSGAAETVLKGYIADNAARLGLPVTVAPDLARGSTISASIRMQPLSDRLIPLLTGSGIGLTVVQDGPDEQGTGFLVDVYETTAYPHTLTEASGIVQSWEWNSQGPEITRCVIGGQGEGTAREFDLRVDTTRENGWQDVIEGFIDARDEEDPTKLQQRGFEATSEGRATAGLNVELADTDSFRYGESVRVGDTVPLEVGGWIDEETGEAVNTVTVTDVLTEAGITYDREDGWLQAPVVGERRGLPEYAFTRQIVNLGRSMRRHNAR